MVKKKLLKKKGERTAEAIIQETIKLFSKYGFDGTSIEAIAKKCGISPSVPLYHFKNKESLIEAALRQILGRNNLMVSDAMSPEDDASIRLTKHFEKNLEWALKYPEEAQFILLLYYFSTFKPQWSKLYAYVLEQARERILQLILAGQRESVFRLDLDPELTAELLHEALMGGIINALSTRLSEKADKARLETKWPVLFKALLKPCV